MALSTGWTGVVVKARLLVVVGLRRRRHDWHTEEAKVRGEKKEAMLGGCGGGVFLGSIWLVLLSHAQSSIVESRGFAAADRHLGKLRFFWQANSSPNSIAAHDYSTHSLY